MSTEEQNNEQDREEAVNEQAENGPDENGPDFDFIDMSDLMRSVSEESIFQHGPSHHPLRGDVIERVQELVENYVKPTASVIVDPLSGARAPAMIDKNGITPVPASIFDQYLEGPRRRRGTAELTTLTSFIQHTNRFKSDATVLFGSDSRDNPSLTAVLDYHAEGHDGAPGFGKHLAVHRFPLSDEWKAWQAANKKPMTMKDFAEFMEDRIIDVILPEQGSFSEEEARFVQTLGGLDMIATPSKLIELSRELHVNENANIKSATKLSSGEGQVVFQTEHTGPNGQPLVIPTMFLIAIPVFKDDAPYQVLARLRYRVANGSVVFFYELWRTDRVFDHAYREAATLAHNETGCPLLMGKPEA